MVDAKSVKQLRDMTGAGMMDCKRALVDTGGDLAKAVEVLREKGLATAAKKAGREAREGIVDAYVHGGGRIGVLLELNCETDFVARTPEFRELAHELSMQVAAMRPAYLSREDVPQHVVDEERSMLEAQARGEGKPDNIVPRVVEGRLEKFFQQVCLLEQPYVRDGERNVESLLKERISQMGENIIVRRFARFETGATD